jgi:hydrogenase nickel incorporation protein HypB
MVRIKVMKAVSAKNDEVAAGIRAELAEQGIKALNIISSPGSGKTTLLERTITHFAPDIRSAVIVGDPFTANDAERLETAGGDAFQLNTEGSCHLTAPMVRAALDDMDLTSVKLLFIENIGNLICPTAWYLGETARATLLSVTEGTDKVDKYRRAFLIAHCVVITKTDLAHSCNFDLEKATADIRALNPQTTVLTLSATKGEGLDTWYDWVGEHLL